MRALLLAGLAACGPASAVSPGPAQPVAPPKPLPHTEPVRPKRAPVEIRFGPEDAVAFAALSADGLVTVVPTLRAPLRYRGRTLEPGMYILRFDADGALRHSERLCRNTEGAAIAGRLSRDGALVVAGAYARTLRFAGKDYPSEGDWDAFLLYDAPGEDADWATTFGGAARESIRSLAISDSSRRIAVGGWAESSFAIAGRMQRGRGSAPDGFAMVYGTDGTELWGTRIIGRGKKAALALAFDHDELLVAGTFTDQLMLQGNTFVTRGGSDIFLGHYDASGEVRQVYHWGGADRDAVADIAISDGGAVLAGSTDGVLTLGRTEHRAKGQRDIVLWRVQHGETAEPSVRLGGSGDEVPERLSEDGAALYGQFSGQTDLGLGTMAATHSPEAFAVELSPELDVLSATAQKVQRELPTGSPSVSLAQTPTGAVLRF